MGGCYFAVWAGGVFFFAVWAGIVFFFCCLGGGACSFCAVWAGGAFFFLAVWAGSVFFFLLSGRGTGVHSLSGLPSSSLSNPTTKKTNHKKKHGFRKAPLQTYCGHKFQQAALGRGAICNVDGLNPFGTMTCAFVWGMRDLS